MIKQRTTAPRYVQPYRYPSPNIPLAAIRRFARQIAERFHPEKIILFGSYAYGKPHNESDVDLMVIMPARNAIDQAIRIDLAFECPFALDVHVRTPYQIRQGLKDPDDRDWFLHEVMTKGTVLYEASHGAMGEQGRRGRGLGKSPRRAHAAAPRRGVLCQQASEKYLKALLEELGLAVPRTHDLKQLLSLLLPHDAKLAPLRRSVPSLTKYAVEYRYPGLRATTRQMEAALRTMQRVRTELRARLGLPP